MDDMTPDADERRLTEYLLGRLRDEDASAVEEQYFADPEFHDRLRAVERDLIDQYVRGELPDPDDFERRYLSSEPRRAKVAFAKALIDSGRAPGVRATAVQALLRPRPALRWRRVWQAAAAGILAGFLVAIFSWRGPGSGSTPADPPTASVQPPPAVPSPPTPPPVTPRPVIALVLLPNATRGADPVPTVAIGAGDDVRLELELESGGFATYRVTVRTAGGAEIWRDDQLEAARAASGERLATTIPAARLAEDDYTVRVQGLSGRGEGEELSGYTFRIRRKP
jgi:hypothetical protein